MEQKRTTSEIIYDHPDFRFLIGTLDKKSPASIYYEIETYICPLEKLDYASVLKDTQASLKQYVKQVVQNRRDIFTTDLIFVMDVADMRMSPKKKSFLSVKIFTKLPEEKAKQSFKTISPEYAAVLLDELENIKNILENGMFKISKTKN